MVVTKSAYVKRLEQAIVAVEDSTASKEQEEFVKHHEQRVLEWMEWGTGFMTHAKECVYNILDFASDMLNAGKIDDAEKEIAVALDLTSFMNSWGVHHPWYFNELEREMRPAWDVSVLDKEYADERQQQAAAIDEEAKSMLKECMDLLAYNEADWDSDDEWLTQQLESYDCDTLVELFLVLCEIADNEE